MTRFAFLSVLIVCLSCAYNEPHPCELASHCVRDNAEKSSSCEDGYVWEDPSDSSNFNCVAMASVDNAGDTGASAVDYEQSVSDALSSTLVWRKIGSITCGKRFCPSYEPDCNGNYNLNVVTFSTGSNAVILSAREKSSGGSFVPKLFASGGQGCLGRSCSEDQNYVCELYEGALR